MVALPSLQSDLGATFAQIQLVVAIYTLAFACTLVVGGRLGDIYGRKRVFLIGMVGFTIASALCGGAPDPTFLIFARVLQGLFSGLMFPQVLSIIQVTFSSREKPKALAFYGASIGLATISGPVLGGWLIDLDILGMDWRSIFYVNLPIGILALVLGAARIKESSAEGSRKLDILGSTVLTLGLFLLILPLVLGREHDWPAWSLWSLAISPLFLLVFVLHELRLTRESESAPLVPMTLFRERSFSVGVLMSLLFFSGIPSFFMVFFIVLQVGFGYSAVAAGGVTLTGALMIGAGSARSPVVVRHLGTRALALGCGLLVLGAVAFMVSLNWAGTDLRAWWLIPALMIFGLGAGFFIAPNTGIILAGIRSRVAGAASGVLATAQQVGAAVGVAVVGIIFFGLLGSNAASATDSVTPQLRQDLAAAGLSEEQQDEVVGGLTVCFHDRTHQKDLSATPASCTAIEERMAAAPLPEDTKEAVRTAVVDTALTDARKDDFTVSLQQVLWWQIGVFGVSFLLVFLLPKVRDVQVLPGGA
jgi:EmrB/QacA subfamily drug resistance transporter